MGIGVIGGLIFASLLTLFIIPAVYSYLATEKSAEQAKEVQRVIDKITSQPGAVNI